MHCFRAIGIENDMSLAWLLAAFVLIRVSMIWLAISVVCSEVARGKLCPSPTKLPSQKCHLLMFPPFSQSKMFFGSKAPGFLFPPHTPWLGTVRSALCPSSLRWASCARPWMLAVVQTFFCLTMHHPPTFTMFVLELRSMKPFMAILTAKWSVKRVVASWSFIATR